MQAARILPLLTAVLAAAYSLFAADWPSGMAAIAALPILAVVQAIIFAEAGESASTENIAAVINNLILDLIGNNPALCRTHATRILSRPGSRKKTLSMLQSNVQAFAQANGRARA